MPSVCVRHYRQRLKEAKRFHRYLECLTQHYVDECCGTPKDKSATTDSRYLYVSPVNRDGKKFLAKIIERIDLPNFDIVALCYDDTSFHEELFRNIRVIRKKGIKWQLMKQYVTPDYCKEYDYIFAWDDDIDPMDFSFLRFIDIMKRNRLEYAQPAIAPHSHVNVELTRARSGTVGRFTDYVENMAPVFTRDAWTRYWNALEEGRCNWGWQHSSTARSSCGYRRMGIIDQEHVAHMRPCQSNHSSAPEEAKAFHERHPHLKKAMKISYAYMR